MRQETKDVPISSQFVGSVIRPHAELAVDLLRLVRTKDTRDPTHRFQIAAVIIYLAGIDKALGLALQLLYLAGKIKWEWLRGGRKGEAGRIVCNPGLTAKLDKLTELGFDLSDLKWLVDLRNQYVHACSIEARYGLAGDFDKGRLVLRPSGPEVNFPGSPLLPLESDLIEQQTESLIKELGEFLDRQGWEARWRAAQARLEQLPENPEPYYSEVVSRVDDLDAVHVILERLNAESIGEGLQHLLE